MPEPRTITTTYVKTIGVELEGGWDEVPEGCTIVGDGSVMVRSRHVGEIRSPVFNSVYEIGPWVESAYPQTVGKSCGIHVHMAFGVNNDGVVSLLSDTDDYRRFLMRHLHYWGSRNKVRLSYFWDRLDGLNNFCLARDNGRSVFPYIGELGDGGDRYTQVNFCSYRNHKTVEVRVLPAFKSKRLAADAIVNVALATDTFVFGSLSRLGDPEVVSSPSVEI